MPIEIINLIIELDDYAVPVLLTPELSRDNIYTIAYNSNTGLYYPYLFVGYFTDGQEFHRWYFANARRHEEMIMAVEKLLKRSKLSCIYGQIYFNAKKLLEGELCFSLLTLLSNLPDKKAEELLRSVIEPELLTSEFAIKYPD